MYPPEFKNTILDRANIIDVIGQSIALKRTGANYQCLCPFHEDKNPSMYIWENSQRYKCFSCGAGGDVITFMIEYFHLSFMDALKELATRLSIQLPVGRNENKKYEKSHKEDIFKINATALNYYKSCFDKGNNPAVSYMSKRNFSEKILNEFSIGFSDRKSSALFDKLKENEYPEDLIIKSGVFKLNEDKEVYPAFYSRVLFPIEDERGRVLGFGGRTLVQNTKSAKYVNTSETEVFHKRKLLFGLKQSLESIKQKKIVIIAEGYTDVMMMHQYGYHNTVAVLGTALTVDHIRLISRYSKEAVLLLDGDAAGRNAMMRSMETFLSEDFKVSIALLPEGKDPCEMLQDSNTFDFQHCLDNRISVIDFLLDELKSKYDLETVEGKTSASNEIITLFSVIKNVVKLSTLITQFSEKLAIDELSLRSNFSQLQEKNRRFSNARSVNMVSIPPEVSVFKIENYGKAVERLLLSMALKNEDVMNDILALSSEDIFIDKHLSKIFNLLIKLEKHEDLNKHIHDECSENEIHLVDQLLYTKIDLSTVDLVKELDRLQQLKKMEYKKLLQTKIKRAEDQNDDDALNQLLVEIASLK
ncbi:MAG: DNA primase [Planctomycetota bacterium]|nr:MAG: DNA primase [Planctomycetota bacterium]